MRKILGVCLLALLLTGTASAGIMPNDTPAPPPPPPTSTAQEPTGGEIPNEIMQDGIMPNDATVTLAQITLQLLAVLL